MKTVPLVRAMLAAVAAVAALAATGCEQAPTRGDRPPGLVEDFEAGPWRWRNASAGTVEASVAPAGDAHDGAQAGRFRIGGTHGAGSWSDLHLPLPDGWPAGARAITFWARAETPCAVLAKVVEGVAHEEIEHFGAVVRLTPAWQRFRLAPADFSVHIFSSAHDPARVNHRLDRDQISAFGFAEQDFPVEFLVDQIAFE